MSQQDTSVRSLNGRRAAARRWGQPHEELDRQYAAEKLAAQIRSTIESFPPLTTEQRERLAVLLRGDVA